MREQAHSATLLVDPKEAARLLAVSPRTLWALTFEKQPALPHLRCGRLVRYSLADLNRWIEAQRAGGEVR
jgi:excisionase family DNA binding protein